MKGMEELQFVIDNVEALGLETSAGRIRRDVSAGT